MNRFTAMTMSGRLFVCTDNMAEVTAATVPEKARRALLLYCERRPLSQDSACVTRTR